MTESGITISGEQRDALYKEVLTHLNGVDDLRLAIEDDKDFERADRLAREITDNLRLIFDGLGWGERSGAVKLTTPPDDLRRILGRLKREMAERYEEERPEQEAFRANWDHTALVRDTCDEVLGQLRGGDE